MKYKSVLNNKSYKLSKETITRLEKLKVKLKLSYDNLINVLIDELINK